MLVHRPEARWPIQKVLERLATILSHSRQQDDTTDYCTVGRPRDTNTDQFPPLWDNDEYCQRGRPRSQASTQTDLTLSALSKGYANFRDREGPADAIGSKHDLGQIENIFADQIIPFRSPGLEHARIIDTEPGPSAPREGHMPQNGQDTHGKYPQSSSIAIVHTSGQKLSLQRGYARVPGQLLDLYPDTARQNSPYTDLLRVNGNIRVSHGHPEPDLLTTPTTSHCPASSDAHSTCTEEPRPSMSSRTDESMVETEGCSERSTQPQAVYAVPGRGTSKPEVPVLAPPGDGTISNCAEGTDISPVAEDVETRFSRRHGLASLWKKIGSFRKIAFQPILRGGRQRSGRSGR